MTIPELPQEVLDYIVDLIAAEKQHDTPKNLRNLSLAARCFRDRCYAHLYEDAHFAHPQTSARRDKGKRSTLESNPKLCKLIRTCRISWTIQPYVPTTAHEQYPWTAWKPGMPTEEMRPYLNGVRNVSIVATTFGFAWAKLYPEIQNRIYGILTTSPVTHLSLTNTPKFPLHVIELMSALEVFSARGTSRLILSPSVPSDEPEYVPPGRRPFAHLTEITLHSEVVQAHKDLQLALLGSSYTSFPSLRKVSLIYGAFSKTYANIDSVLQGMADKSLQTIPELRYLNIVIHDSAFPRQQQAAFTLTLPPTIPQLLLKMLGNNPQPSLTTLDLRLGWTAEGTDGVSLELLSESLLVDPAAGWGALDDVLSNPAMYPELTTVNILASYIFTSWADDLPVPEEIRRRLPLEFREVLSKTGPRVNVEALAPIPGRVGRLY
ncbi:hypothetical protein NMY22_g241 [Coprinellus aureogranulatus]|nr:hypothetical protein NMY22_g241 [Coprinellus aureogranulatus]